MGYDKKFKEKVLEQIKKGNSQERTAKLFGIGTATIKEWKKRVETGEGLEARIRRRNPKKIEPEKLRAYVRENPDAYLSEIASEFGCVESAIRKAMKKLGITRKKRRSRTKNEKKKTVKLSEKI